MADERSFAQRQLDDLEDFSLAETERDTIRLRRDPARPGEYIAELSDLYVAVLAAQGIIVNRTQARTQLTEAMRARAHG